jgi:hypothetical protein
MRIGSLTRRIRERLCDKGIPCPDCLKQLKDADEKLTEVYDIVCDATVFKGTLNLAGPNPLTQIKEVIEK